VKLQQLDDKYLPLAAERVAAVADRLAVRRDRVRSSVHAVRATSLRDLDNRYATSGPLGLLREIPQIGFVLIAAIFLSGAGVAVSRENARNRAAQQQSVQPGPGLTAAPTGDNLLGPRVGDRVAAYEAKAARGLIEAVTGSPDGTRLALVSFTGYRTPAQTTTLLSGYPVRRAFLRAKAAGKEAAQLPVDIKGDLLPQLRQAYSLTARSRLEAQKSFQGYVDSIVVTTKEEQDFKNQYAAFAKTTGLEARAYQRGCACVYAALVEATASQLQQLRARPGVRVIELASKDLRLSQVQVLPPLLPEARGVVTKQPAGDAQP
jgi:hypothetical protein